LEEGVTFYFATTSFDADGIESDFSAETNRYIPWSTSAGSNWISDLKGTYAGLFSEDPPEVSSSGTISLSVAGRAAYSGRLKLGGRSRSFTGRFDSRGRATNMIKLDGRNSEVLQFQVGTGDEADLLLGQLRGITWTARLTGLRQSFNATTNPAPCKGVYTIVLAGDSSNSDAPEGYGYGVVKVSGGGNISFSARLADGTKVTQGATLSNSRLWPVYVPLSGGAGVLVNWLAFTQQNNSDIVGRLKWIKPVVRGGAYYPDGFANEIAAIASTYFAPAPPAKPLLDPPEVIAAFSGGNLQAASSIPLLLDASGHARDLSGAGISMKFSPSTGLFQGRVADGESGRQWNFGGAVILNMNMGFGTMLGQDKSSRVVISP
jgi:hypothetical protein